MALFFTEDEARLLKNSITALDAVQELGLEIVNGNILCTLPDHHDTRINGSCKIRRGGRIYCFACKQYLHPVTDVFMTVGGMSYYESLCKIAEMTNTEHLYESVNKEEKEKKKEKFPLRGLTEEEKKLLGFAHYSKTAVPKTNTCFIGCTDIKPEAKDRCYRDADGNYILETKNELNWYSLLADDPLSYRIMVLNKCYEKLEFIKEQIEENRKLKSVTNNGLILYDYIIEHLEEQFKNIYELGVEFGLLEIEKAKNQKLIAPFESRTA